MNFDIDQLPITDDLDVSLDATDYVDVQPQLPLAAGNFGFRIKTFDLRRKYQGKVGADGQVEVDLQDGKYPSITLQMLEVVEPAESARGVALYQDVRTKPRVRKDFTSGGSALVSDLSDLIRSADSTASFTGLKEGIALLASLVAQGAIFYAKFDWTARDANATREALDDLKARANENGEDLKSTAIQTATKEIYKKFTKRGQGKFRNANGGFVPFLISTEGEQIAARTEIVMDGFISQVNLDKVKLGPKFATAKAA